MCILFQCIYNYYIIHHLQHAMPLEFGGKVGKGKFVFRHSVHPAPLNFRGFACSATEFSAALCLPIRVR